MDAPPYSSGPVVPRRPVGVVPVRARSTHRVVAHVPSPETLRGPQSIGAAAAVDAVDGEDGVDTEDGVEGDLARGRQGQGQGSGAVGRAAAAAAAVPSGIPVRRTSTVPCQPPSQAPTPASLIPVSRHRDAQGGAGTRAADRGLVGGRGGGEWEQGGQGEGEGEGAGAGDRGAGQEVHYPRHRHVGPPSGIPAPGMRGPGGRGRAGDQGTPSQGAGAGYGTPAPAPVPSLSPSAPDSRASAVVAAAGAGAGAGAGVPHRFGDRPAAGGGGGGGGGVARDGGEDGVGGAMGLRPLAPPSVLSVASGPARYGSRGAMSAASSVVSDLSRYTSASGYKVHSRMGLGAGLGMGPIVTRHGFLLHQLACLLIVKCPANPACLPAWLPACRCHGWAPGCCCWASAISRRKRTWRAGCPA